ncbi:MAG: hypothetical protein ACKODU_08530 [Limnohabitans sp.]
MNKPLLSLLLSSLALGAAPLAAQPATPTPPVQTTRPAPAQPTAPVPATPPTQAARPSASGGCLVAQFKTVTLSQNDVEQRTRQAQDWLLRNIGRCSTEQLSAIRSNSPSWLGHALTPQLSGLIEGAIEAKASNSPALMAQLYESLGREGTASVVTLRNPPARAPVVQPLAIQGGLAGAVNYGNVVGPSTSLVNQTGNNNSSQSAQQLQSGINNQQQQAQTGAGAQSAQAAQTNPAMQTPATNAPTPSTVPAAAPEPAAAPPARRP